MAKKKKGSEGTDWEAFIKTMEEAANSPLPEVEDPWAFKEGLAQEIAEEVPLDKDDKPEVVASKLQQQFKDWNYFRSFGRSDIIDEELRVVYGLGTPDIEWAVIDSEENICRSVLGTVHPGGNLLTLNFSSLTVEGTWYVAVKRKIKRVQKVEPLNRGETNELKTLTCISAEGTAVTQISGPDLVGGCVRIIHNLNSTELDMMIIQAPPLDPKRLKTSGPNHDPNQFIINLSCLGDIDGYVILKISRREEAAPKLRDKTGQKVSSLHISHQKISDTTYKGSVFSSVSLSHVTFIGCDFSNVTFNSASLSDVQFKDCILIGTKFTSCSLNVCGFSGGTVDKVVLQSCSVRSSKLPTNGMNFSGDSSISNCNMYFL